MTGNTLARVGTSNDFMAALCLNGVSIRRDEDGRYSFNDFHEAAGGAAGDSPNHFLRLKNTQKLIAELEEQTAHICVVSTEGRNGGTYGHENLVIAYAAWISAKFYAHVLQTFKEAAIAKLNAERPAPTPEPQVIEDKTMARVSKAIIVLDLLAGSKSYGLTQAEHRNGVHKLIRSHGLPTDMLPAPTDDTYSDEGSATHLLKSAGRCLPVPRFFKLLEEAGIVYHFSRPSTKHKNVLKHSWRFTTEGMRYGYDERVGRSKDYTCLFYVSKFTELLRLISPGYHRLVASGEYKPKWPKAENAEHAEAYRKKMERATQQCGVRDAAYRIEDVR
ncbi:KilA-N domain-containing protein [Paraburkholderia sp. GAS32]|uniref:KilA-N domain-containing protein n=1 Tax=Paraburkholderia sp. GAS32 TaxID=3035129 RepID=UPI003D1F55BA